MVAKLIQDMPILVKLIDKNGILVQNWRVFFQQIADNINRSSPSNAGSPRQVSVLTLGVSPYIYQSNYSGDVRLLIAGGTGVNLQMSRDNVTYYSVGIVAGQITLSQGDFLKITYTIAPSVVAFPA